MRGEVHINPDILTWAIARAGYDLQEFLLKNPRVEKWLEKIKTPTVKQLEDLAHKLHLPFGYLFLPEPPEETIPFPFFRTGGGAVAFPTSWVRLHRSIPYFSNI